ncbi:penicillin-binding protein activator [Marinobacter salinisoli]|uniref:Penicillin-binding protein activator n=1 Tax=Marinobacter salinisoli TaxID=2769486 RepID=A0ABX7MUU4_9GAMM|nr:penicillin-binding protein activator [Marinobacter salinisoli]QSP96157.1 penicillin-binding protein activator [Marinobacter salinisoli]
MIRTRIHHRALATAFTMALLSAGCAGVNLQSHTAQTPEQALELAEQEANRETAQRYLLRTASEFQQTGDHTAARTLLQNQQLSQLPPELANQQRLLAMASATALTDSEWARTLTQDLSPQSITSYEAELIPQAADLQSQTFALAGDPISAAMTLVLLGQTDSSTSPQRIHDQVWMYLKEVPDQTLEAAASVAIGYEEQGWLELAAARQPGMELDDQGRVIRRWQNDWPGHPAAQVLPSELSLIASLAESRPESIALALPLSGTLATAGAAIRDGFIAAYYQDESVDHSTTDIRVVDTADAPFSEIYQKLSEQDIDLIVGPLEKDALSTLGSMTTLPVPTLGLNYLPPSTRVPDGLYQFGLSAEDEARQIADRLSAENIRNTLVLIPRGEWGDRVESALRTRLTENGSTALDIQRFSREDNLRAVTADLLGITVSRDRAVAVERTIGMDIEFEPRRRQDAEAIIMVADPTIARQFKPLFAFYFGGELPVYSPSIIYEGSPDPARDRDLNRVIFTDIPWILTDSDLKTNADQHLSNTRGQLGRLFAMGSDAWQLSKRLPLLRQVENSTLQGQTGTLSMTDTGSIQRKQLWAQFQNGAPRLLPELESAAGEEALMDNEPGTLQAQ